MEWRHEAKCRDTNPEMFSTPNKEDKAVRFCLGRTNGKRCPVLEQCRDDAIRGGETWTVRGGMTPTDIEAAIRQRNSTKVHK